MAFETTRNLFRRYGLVLVAGVMIAALAGCRSDEIRQYSVASPKAPRDVTRLGHYDLPKGWVRQTPKDKITLAAFRVGEGEQAADITITRLQGHAGGLEANVERWRVKSLKLEPLKNPKDAKELAQAVKVAGKDAHAVDLTGSEQVPAEQRRIVGVMVFAGPVSWFFKMQGPVDFVGEQKKAFEAFVESIEFGATGANDG